MSKTHTVIQKKICMLGDFAVGKTSLVRRFVEGRFDDRYMSTIGVKVSRRVVDLSENTTMNLLIWDLAGSEEFTGVQASYLQGTSGALLICDLTRGITIESIKQNAERLREINPNVSLIIAGNKLDLAGQREIEGSNLVALSDEVGSPWFITSAKTGDGVEKAFQSLAQRILNHG